MCPARAGFNGGMMRVNNEFIKCKERKMNLSKNKIRGTMCLPVSEGIHIEKCDITIKLVEVYEGGAMLYIDAPMPVPEKEQMASNDIDSLEDD